MRCRRTCERAQKTTGQICDGRSFGSMLKVTLYRLADARERDEASFFEPLLLRADDFDFPVDLPLDLPLALEEDLAFDPPFDFAADAPPFLLELPLSLLPSFELAFFALDPFVGLSRLSTAAAARPTTAPMPVGLG
jgi:hypothetical protein